MPRYAFRLRIKADKIAEYERQHTRVWPELLAKLKEDARSGDCVLIMGARDPSLSALVRKTIALFGGPAFPSI